MAPKRVRYYSADDFEVGVTPSQLKRLSKARQVDYLTWWFEQMYEDPANETPYNSEEGGYLYIYGGPYDANEELADEFGHLVSEEAIEQAADYVQRDGTFDWAPGTRHPDQRRAAEEYEEQHSDSSDPFDIGFDLQEIEARLAAGSKPTYGDQVERNRRKQILRDLDELKFDLPTAEHGGMGHNQPPKDMVLTDDEIVAVRDAATNISVELEKTAPDATSVLKSTNVLQKAWKEIGKRLGIAADKFAESFGTAAGEVAGKAAGSAMVAAVGAVGMILYNVAQSLGEWLQYVTLPF